MKRTELVLSGMSVACFGLYLLGTAGISLFFMLLMSLLGVLFGYFGFAHLNGVRLADVFKRSSYLKLGKWNVVVAVFAGLGMGLVVNGVLFRVMFWENSDLLLRTGLVWLALMLLAVMTWRAVSDILKIRILLRAAIFMGIGVVFLALPAHSWFAIRYRAYPAYVEAMKNYRYAPSVETYNALDKAKNELVK